MRKFLIAFAVLSLGCVGLAQVTGSWSGKLALLPAPPELTESILELGYTFGEWKLTSTSIFDSEGYKSQEFAVSGTFAFLDLEASLIFSPVDRTIHKLSYTVPDAWTGFGYDFTITDSNWVILGPAFQELDLSASGSFAGVEFGIEISLFKDKKLQVPVDDITSYQLLLDFPPYLLVGNDWIMQPHPDLQPVLDMEPCYNKYELTYANASLVATKVTFKGQDLDGNPVSHTITGMFEVYHFDAATGTVILTLGAETYLWQYIGHYGGEHNWDLTTVTISVDPEDVEVYVLFPIYMLYTLTATVEPISVEISFDDVSTGIQFKEATVTLSDLSLCCGIAYSAELHFTKCEGFDYIKFSIDKLFDLCCDISFGVDVEFGVDYKKVTPKFSWGGIEGCVTVWGDLQELEEGVGIGGWELYGYKIYCELAECYDLEIVTVFNVAEVEEILDEDIFKDDEFEYIKLGACGPACCGGTWTLDLSIFFAESDSLFGITRFVVDASVPIMEALTIGVSFETPNTMSVSWEFTF